MNPFFRKNGVELWAFRGKVRKENKDYYFITSGFWPRVRARALRAPVFLGSLKPQMGAARPPRSFAAP
jgi:hypothetical protein